LALGWYRNWSDPALVIFVEQIIIKLIKFVQVILLQTLKRLLQTQVLTINLGAKAPTTNSSAYYKLRRWSAYYKLKCLL